MPGFTREDLDGKTIKSSDGSKIGKVTNLYLDYQTEKPEWISVATGLFGTREALLPLAAAQRDGDDLVVPFDKDTVKNAPHHDPDAELTQQQEAELFAYYRIPYGGDTVTAAGGPAAGSAVTNSRTAAGRDLRGPNTDSAMTRSEERLHVGTESVETGRARLRKYIVTENVTQTVPVSHEEVRVEREPVTDANRDAATSGADLTDEEAETTLHEERPVTAKETVPVERVSLQKDTVTDEIDVTDTVREERIDTEGAERGSARR